MLQCAKAADEGGAVKIVAWVVVDEKFVGAPVDDGVVVGGLEELLACVIF
jgi:hypothetical protein